MLATTYNANTNPVTKRPAVDAAVYERDQTRLTMTGVAIEWSNTDFTDYIAGGYWVHVDLSSLSLQNTVPGAELGAFIDGPDYQDRASMRVTGTATYSGIAAGAYVTRYGTDITIPGVDSVSGSLGTGDYRGLARLVADFGKRSVSGRIDSISIDGVVVTPQGNRHPVDQMPGFTMHLNDASISQNGRVSGPGMRVTHPSLSIAEATGTWASRFSRVDGGHGNPQAIAGTHAAKFKTGGGTEAVFTGAHYVGIKSFD